MVDHQLSLLPDWRFCNVKNGDKIPYPNNWQNNPLTLSQVTSDNIGVILGEHSNGLCAIDFDGIEAIEHWSSFTDIDISELPTVMWSSGKDYRCQAAFTVPKIYWSVLKRKVINKLEFRWGGQSVLPPSKLNDGRQYMWLKSPNEYQVQELPEPILVYWLQLIYQELTQYDDIKVEQVYTTDHDEEFVNQILYKVSQKVGSLRGEYDLWRTIAWATCHAVGINTARMLMLYYWPDKTKKEMNTLLSWKSNHRSPTLGTLIKLSGISSLERRILELESKVRKL